jgi:hypothetical protein
MLHAAAHACLPRVPQQDRRSLYVPAAMLCVFAICASLGHCTVVLPAKCRGSQAQETNEVFFLICFFPPIFCKKWTSALQPAWC